MADQEIVQATIRRCILYQKRAADYARNAMLAYQDGDYEDAIELQMAARRNADEAWTRLERLI